jgi:NAD(P)-dependent dehydrogenase (short-subunit alcohol dehydrogenase family)
MERFFKAMAIELAPHGIGVKTLCPTFVEPRRQTVFRDVACRESVLSKISSAASAPSRT